VTVDKSTDITSPVQTFIFVHDVTPDFGVFEECVYLHSM